MKGQEITIKKGTCKKDIELFYGVQLSLKTHYGKFGFGANYSYREKNIWLAFCSYTRKESKHAVIDKQKT